MIFPPRRFQSGFDAIRIWELLPAALRAPLLIPWAFPTRNGSVTPDKDDWVVRTSSGRSQALSKQPLVGAAFATQYDLFPSVLAAKFWTKQSARALASVYAAIKVETKKLHQKRKAWKREVDRIAREQKRMAGGREVQRLRFPQ